MHAAARPFAFLENCVMLHSAAWSHAFTDPHRFVHQVDHLMRTAPGTAAFEAVERGLEASFEAALQGALEAPPAGRGEPARSLPAAAGPPTLASLLPTQAAAAWSAGEPFASAASSGVSPATAVAPVQVPNSPRMEAWGSAIEKVAARHGVPAWLVANVVRQESGGNPDATSPVGAMGLMQLMPATAAELGVASPYDPMQNLDGGVRYLAKMIALFDGDLTRAVAAYNAGPGSVKRHGGVPPFAETQDYVRRILGEGANGNG